MTISALNGAYSELSWFRVLLYLGCSVLSSAVIKGIASLRVEFMLYLANRYGVKDVFIVLLLMVLVASLFVYVPFACYEARTDYANFIKFGNFC